MCLPRLPTEEGNGLGKQRKYIPRDEINKVHLFCLEYLDSTDLKWKRTKERLD